ncbi:MAG: hypothetical protein SHS37scaffold220_21 [Phage 67_12]|nr:MAG: hypothetical protein SHS37scaffold220_21 [Phage 67_12]
MSRGGIHATCPQVIASIALMHAAMDETIDHSMTCAARDRLTDDQIEQLTDEADAAARKVALDDMHHVLRRMFLRAIEHAHAASTPKLPRAVRYNAATESDPRDRWDYRVFNVPVTVVAHDLLEADGPDNHLHLLIASDADLAAMRAAQLQALAADYAESEAEALVAAEWQE